MVFPEGIYYNRKKDQCRTPRVNDAFRYIAGLARVLGQKEKRELQLELHGPSFVEADIELSNFLADLQELELFMKRFEQQG